MAQESNTSLRRLRKRVERALASGQRGSAVVHDLEAMVRESEEVNGDVLFAHRQLAELRLEESPWQAALHLRSLLAAGAQDDGVHALMGLCQALLGNFRAAIAAYKRAVQLAPRNPWYHHNLGHLLDVGLGQAQVALRHLVLAYELQPHEDEIGASLAHCHARLGRLEDAERLAREALARAPDNGEHRALLAWIEEGAPGKAPAAATQRPRVSAPGNTPGNSSERPESTSTAGTDGVTRLLCTHMMEAGFGPEHVRRALALWADFQSSESRPAIRTARPSAYAAAVEYAIARIEGARVTRAALAERYGVSRSVISTRYLELREALTLVPGDPRYFVAR
jgi:tetratricopeptide (TPR) repeat protein